MMSAEDRAAQPLSPEQFSAILRTVREAVRAEMRAEFEGRKQVLREWSKDLNAVVDQADAEIKTASREAAVRHYAAQLNSAHIIPASVAGVPV